MLEWKELATLAGPGGPIYTAQATAEDGAELTVQVWALARPGRASGRILAAVRGHLGAAAPEQPRFQVSSTLRAVSTAELLEAVHEACQGSPEWWAVMLPWRSDLEVPEGSEVFLVGGYLFGPVPTNAAGMIVQLIVGGGAAAGSGAHRVGANG